MKTGQGEMEKTESGCMRESNEARGRFDLIPYEALEALAKWYEQGSHKYEERNWEKGISVKDCINRMCRHAGKVASGWTDEDHLAAVMWNAAAAITMMRRKPECNDHAWDKQISPSKAMAEACMLWSHDPHQAIGKNLRIEEFGNGGITIIAERVEPVSPDSPEQLPDHRRWISADDKYFLVTALTSGGISDLITLKEWVDRRVDGEMKNTSQEVFAKAAFPKGYTREEKVRVLRDANLRPSEIARVLRLSLKDVEDIIAPGWKAKNKTIELPHNLHVDEQVRIDSKGNISLIYNAGSRLIGSFEASDNDRIGYLDKGMDGGNLVKWMREKYNYSDAFLAKGFNKELSLIEYILYGLPIMGSGEDLESKVFHLMEDYNEHIRQ